MNRPTPNLCVLVSASRPIQWRGPPREVEENRGLWSVDASLKIGEAELWYKPEVLGGLSQLST